MQSSSQIITTKKVTPSLFLQAGCPSCRPTNSVRAPNGKVMAAYRRVYGFSRWTWVSQCQNVSILDFIGAKGDRGGEW